MPTLLERIEANAATRLALPENHSPADALLRYKNFLKVETHRLKILHRGGASGREVCRARGAILDTFLRHLWESAKKGLPPQDQKEFASLALVALGGYGRAELNPFSDIDFMFLHDGHAVIGDKPKPHLAKIVDGILYTLWDVGLKVGHSTRSIDECVKIANSEMQPKTAMIEARLIIGNAQLFEKLQKAILAKCVIGQEQKYIEARVQDQASRRAKYGNSVLMQEPNIKNGCGGLRDYQNLVWMTFFKFRTRSLNELQEKEMISESEFRQLESAYDFLLRARNELHYNVERAADVLTKSVQPSVAHYLGYTDRSPSNRLEKFMGDYYTHARNIDWITRTVERRLALLPQPKPTSIPTIRRLFSHGKPQPVDQWIDSFKIVDGEIHPGSKFVFRDYPKRMMRVFLYAQQRGLKLSPDLAQMIRNQLSLVDNSFVRDPHVHETFLEILDQRGNVAPILRAMHEVGFLGKYMPEFGKLTCLVQHEFYHQYTTDEHTLVCIEKLDQVWEAKAAPYNAYSEIFQSIERPYVLYLALLLHDSGKAYRTGKHEDVGGKLALKVARRMGLETPITQALKLLIVNHLTMAQVSQRRDLDDPAVIRTFAKQMHSVENLIMLTLHTFADSMGTSDQLWNGFKDSLLWTLFQKTRTVLTGGTDFLRAEEKQRELLAAEVRELAPKSFSNDELHAHFENLPARYFQISNARDIVADLAQVHRFMHRQLSEKDEALVPVVSWHNEPDRGYTVVNICTWDRAGLFSKINGALTAAGLNILSAEIVTRTDGIVLDTFSVTDLKSGVVANREERDKFEALLDRVLSGEEVDLSALIQKQTKAGAAIYKSHEGERIPTVIHFDNETSDSKTVIDIETEDRAGLLYWISQAFNDLGINILLAKVLTEKGAAIDTFYVTDSDGGKILDLERQKKITKKLRTILGDTPSKK